MTYRSCPSGYLTIGTASELVAGLMDSLSGLTDPDTAESNALGHSLLGVNFTIGDSVYSEHDPSMCEVTVFVDTNEPLINVDYDHLWPALSSVLHRSGYNLIDMMITVDGEDFDHVDRYSWRDGMLSIASFDDLDSFTVCAPQDHAIADTDSAFMSMDSVVLALSTALSFRELSLFQMGSEIAGLLRRGPITQGRLRREIEKLSANPSLAEALCQSLDKDTSPLR